MTRNYTLSISTITTDLLASKSGIMFIFLLTVLSRLFFVSLLSFHYYLTQNHKQQCLFH